MIRNILRVLFNLLAWGYVAGVPLQVYFAGLGVFRVDLGSVSGFGRTTYFATHINFGMLLGLTSLVMLILAPFTKLRRSTIGWAALLFGLNVAQSLLLWVGGENGAVSALHPANAIFIFAVSVTVARAGLRQYRAERSGEPSPAAEMGLDPRSVEA